ncbi:AgmX/PglI C-terminal domain-containing protein, partial [Fibrobacter sp. UBA3718]|uniref:AgmX/PglI C-terminal domain-containing protein n=1 Tax=Fibrobacter sp. UBA3718 TaxID=1946531 RepID=UPI0025C46216
PGRVLWAVHYPFPRYLYSAMVAAPDSVYVDGKGDFLSMEGEGDLGMIPPRGLKLPAEGDSLATLSPNSMRRVWRGDAAIAPLSAFDVIVRTLIRYRKWYADRWDVDRISLYIDGSFFRQNRFHELTPLIIALKEIGFRYVRVDVDDSDDAFRFRSMEMAHREIYRLTGLKPSMSLPRGFRVASSSRAIFKKLVGMEKSKKFKKNIDKLLEEAAGSSKAESTRPSGKVLIPSWADDIKVRGSRSAKDVLEIMHQREPGLRHVYNKFLKKKPGFEGRVVLRLQIASSGEVVRTAVAYSSTGYEEFDNAVSDYVGGIPFGEVESGSAKVVVPLTFYQ